MCSLRLVGLLAPARHPQDRSLSVANTASYASYVLCHRENELPVNSCGSVASIKSGSLLRENDLNMLSERSHFRMGTFKDGNRTFRVDD